MDLPEALSNIEIESMSELTKRGKSNRSRLIERLRELLLHATPEHITLLSEHLTPKDGKALPLASLRSAMTALNYWNENTPVLEEYLYPQSTTEASTLSVEKAAFINKWRGIRDGIAENLADECEKTEGGRKFLTDEETAYDGAGVKRRARDIENYGDLHYVENQNHKFHDNDVLLRKYLEENKDGYSMAAQTESSLYTERSEQSQYTEFPEHSDGGNTVTGQMSEVGEDTDDGNATDEAYAGVKSDSMDVEDQEDGMVEEDAVEAAVGDVNRDLMDCRD